MRGYICSDCRNHFMQPPRCMTCGAQQLYDNTVRSQSKEIERLRAALRLAVDAVEHWASYASPYFQEKHDLAGDLQKLRAALGEKE